MSIDHEFLVTVAKSYGLFYLIGLSVIVLAYSLWPANKKPFERAAKSIVEDEDRPWQ